MGFSPRFPIKKLPLCRLMQISLSRLSITQRSGKCNWLACCEAMRRNLSANRLRGRPLYLLVGNADEPSNFSATSFTFSRIGRCWGQACSHCPHPMHALDHFLGQMGKFSTDESALKKLLFPSSSKNNQEKEVSSHYDIGNDFNALRLTEHWSYS